MLMDTPLLEPLDESACCVEPTCDGFAAPSIDRLVALARLIQAQRNFGLLLVGLSAWKVHTCSIVAAFQEE